jgi:1-deoxyxylulose-5-phosphate synthase
MEKRKLKNTELVVSRACLGTMTFGSQVDRTTARRMVDCCLDRGVNFIDTANVYNQGESETILGEVLKNRRDQVTLASKVGIPLSGQPKAGVLSRGSILAAVEDTLRRLQTDWLDIYYLHQPDYSVPVGETLEVMDCLVRSGKIRYVGASNYAGWQVCRMLWLSDKNGFPPISVVQPLYNLLARRVEQEFLPMCGELNLSAVAYNPLAGGLLTGKHCCNGPLSGTRFDGNQAYLDRYWNQVNLSAVAELAALAKACGRSLASLSLAWLLHHTSAECLILGASRLEQLEQNLDSVEGQSLPLDAVAASDAVWRKVCGLSPEYNR